MNKILVYLMVVVTSYLGMHASCGRNINYRAIQKRAIRGYTVFDFGRGAIEWKEIATRHNKGYLIEAISRHQQILSDHASKKKKKFAVLAPLFIFLKGREEVSSDSAYLFCGDLTNNFNTKAKIAIAEGNFVVLVRFGDILIAGTQDDHGEFYKQYVNDSEQLRVQKEQAPALIQQDRETFTPVRRKRKASTELQKEMLTPVERVGEKGVVT